MFVLKELAVNTGLAPLALVSSPSACQQLVNTTCPGSPRLSLGFLCLQSPGVGYYRSLSADHLKT